MPSKAAQEAPQGTQPGPMPCQTAKTPQKPFRLASPRAKESDVQAQIVDYLKAQLARGRIAWFARCNSGSVVSTYKGRRSFTRFYQLYLRGVVPAHKGMPDLHGMLPDGRYFALETKRLDEEPTDEQARFLAAVRAGGGIAAVVRGFEDAERALAPNNFPQQTDK